MPGRLSAPWFATSAFVLSAAVAAATAAEGAGSKDEALLTAASAQRLAAAVDAAASAAASSEQLAATARSVLSAGDEANKAQAEPALIAPIRSLEAINAALRGLLQRLRDELATLFSTGRSEDLRRVLNELAGLPRRHFSALSDAASASPAWTQGCRAHEAAERYAGFEALHAEHRALEDELRRLAGEVFWLRDERAAADGTLAGLEERSGLRRAPRPGEEYVLARYLGSSLFRWELLRTKVAHHLALTFTSAREVALADTTVGEAESRRAAASEAEQRLARLESRLEAVAGTHKRLADRRSTIGKELRTQLKSLVLSCEVASGEAPSSEESAAAGVSKRFKVLRGSRLGVRVQVAEEFARFLNGTFAHALPQTVALLEEVLAPYAAAASGDNGGRGGDGAFVLPKTWKAKPKIGRWWEWLEGHKGAGGEGSAAAEGKPILDSEQFQKRFAAAKRRFSVRVSAGEPVVMGYLLWVLLEEAMGEATSRNSGGEHGRTEVLALPSPGDVAVVTEPSGGVVV